MENKENVRKMKESQKETRKMKENQMENERKTYPNRKPKNPSP